MTRACLILAIACAGCGVTDQPYEVIAVANLAPGSENIAGPLELLGRGEPGPDASGYHMVVASRVRLPDDKPRRIRLYTAVPPGQPSVPGSCNAPRAEVRSIWNLGEIRRVGDETHFFTSDVEIGDRVLTVDVTSQFAFLNLLPDSSYYAFSAIAIVEALVPGSPNVPGIDFSPPGSAPSDWLACGAFVIPQ